MNSPFPPGDGFSFEEPLEAPGGGTAGGSFAPPLSPAAPLPEIPSPAPLELVATKGLADVMARRLEQWLKFGHSPEADAQLPVHFFARELHAMVGAVLEDSRRGGRLAIMRKHAVTLAAFALATVDRIDAEPPEEEIPF